MRWNELSCNASCNNVNIWSQQFKTHAGYDIVTINGKEYSGDIAIDEIMDYPLSVSFLSDHNITDDGFVLEWRCRSCCSVIKISGATSDNLDQLYFINGSFISNRPAYIGSNEIYGIWFDENWWVVGSVFDQHEITATSAYIQLNHTKHCPGRNRWEETIVSNWITTDIDIDCDCKYTDTIFNSFFYCYC